MLSFKMQKKTYKYIVIFLLLFFIDTAKCDTKADVKNRATKLEERSKRLYGDTQIRPIKKWGFDTEDPTSYPKGDKSKLAVISHTWIEYYRCTSHVVECMTSSGHLPSVSVAVYEGEVARLPCGLCVAPGESDRVAWFYSEVPYLVSDFKISGSVILSVNVTIYNVQAADAGLYRCQLGTSVGGILVLEILQDDNYQVIEAESYRGTDKAVKRTSTSELISFVLWSPWSECSACDGAGTRRRYGMCYIRMNNSKSSVTGGVSNSIFQEFPSGIACGSWLLPPTQRNDPATVDRNNLIMTGICKIPCKQVFELRSTRISGEVLERASNSDEVISLYQSPPPQLLPAIREVIFAKYGDRLTLKCPGTTLRDIPVTWRRGKYLAERKIGDELGTRVRLTVRNQIIFASVEDTDADIYSCWQSTALVGVTKLEVCRDVWLANDRPAAAGCLTALVAALYSAVRLLRYKLRHGP